ncbi:MAG: putative porin [Chlorobi bacterium]|nr:putative porin [Chlorobiota bacterium]
MRIVKSLSIVDSSLAVSDALKSDSTITAAAKDASLLRFGGYTIGGEKDFILTKENLYLKNYRYTGDFLTYAPFGFKQELGGYGQPHEITLYGAGFGNVEYISDGISLNNRMLNTFDLNLYQSEFIDSLAALPLTRGFLYSKMNNSATVQFITRSKFYDAPYTRIRFVQGPNKEGLLDAQFNSRIAKKIVLSAALTSGSIDMFYPNSDFGGWKVSAKMRYLLSDKINIIGGYRYYGTRAGLNGGVDLEKIKENYPPENVNEILYNEFEAPVRYGEFYSDSPRYQKTTGHNFNLSLLANLFEGSRTEINSFYNFNEVKFRQNENNKYQNIPEIFNDNKTYSAGLNLRQEFFADYFKTEILASYTREKFITPLLKTDVVEDNIFSVGGSASLFLFDSVFVPTGFVKYLNSYGENFSGAGGNADFLFGGGVSLSAGYSSYEKPYSVLEREMMKSFSEKESIQIYEGGISFSRNNLFFSIKYFNSSFYNSAVPVVSDADLLKADQVAFYETENYEQSGVNLYGEALLNFIQLSVNGSYYFGDKSGAAPRVPDFSLFAGGYYVDTLFHDNLHLKAGAEIRFSGKQQYFIYDYQHSRQVYYQYLSAEDKVVPIKNEETDYHIQLDIFISGTIQERAIVHLIFENVLPINSYIVPYYPVKPFGVRFGLSWELFN